MTGRNNTLPGRLLGLAKARPNDVALREKTLGVWTEYTWADYFEGVLRVSAALDAFGLSRNDHICILSENRTEWLFADLGAQAIGLRSVGIYQTNPPEDVAYIVNHSRSRLIFCEDQEQVDKLTEGSAEMPLLEKIVVFDPRGLRHTNDERLIHWSDFIAAGQAETYSAAWLEAQIDALDAQAPAMVVYTSGTTGQPKGAMLSGANAMEMSARLVAQMGVGPQDSLLSYLPLCHVAEKIFTYFMPLVAGSVVHFGESIDTIRQDLREVSPSVFLGVPRIWEKMHASVTLKMKDSSWLKRTLFHWCTANGRAIKERKRTGKARFGDSVLWFVCDQLIFRALLERLGLRRCTLPCSGAAPISKELLAWFHGIGLPIVEGFGMTESAGLISLASPADFRLGSVGRAVPGVEIKLADDGEILAKGANVFLGYLHNPEATRQTIDADGWLHTGDIGSLDKDGYLYITGRKKEIIITAGGKNLSPEKIENALKMSPYIKETVAIGDGRKFISALIQIDLDATGDWATRQEIPFTSFEDLTTKAEVQKLIADEVNAGNDALARVEQIRAFRLLPKELHQDDGEMTATQKVRRRAVLQKFENLVDSMYGGAHG